MCKCGKSVEKVLKAGALAAENKPLCAELARQLEALTQYIEGMDRTPSVELDALGPSWQVGICQLATDMAVVEKKLRDLASPKSRSRVGKPGDGPGRLSKVVPIHLTRRPWSSRMRAR